MTVIRPNSISGVSSITGSGGDISIFRADGTAADVIVNNITSGVITATTFSGNISGATGTFTGNLGVGGVLTYEDVTNIDSVGVITARSDINLGDSIIHIGDTNTKIRFPAADTITAETGGSERLRITSTGQVNIGNTGANWVGPLSIGSGASGAAQVLQIYSNSDTYGAIFFGDATSGAGRYVGDITYNHSSNYMRFVTNGTERLRIDSTGRVVINKTSGDYDGALHVNAISENAITIEGNNAAINWRYANGSSNYRGGIKWHSNGLVKFDAGVSGNGYYYSFFLNNTERMRIQAGGNVMIGNPSHFTSNVAKLDVVHPGANTAPTYVSRFFQETNNTGTDHACIQLRHAAATGSSTATVIAFVNSGGGFLGTIKCTNSATSYNTTSDYRLKENVIPISDGITRLKKLKPSRFNFIVDEAKTLYDGFLAHEVTTAVPEAITGTKDGVDDNGDPDYQEIDQSKLVPLLTAALQEAITKIETLEAKVAALEGS